MDEGTFLRAIHDEPDEPAHRLVFADWLEENGDPGRAGYVRVQVRLDQLGDDRPFEKALLDAYSEYLYAAHGERLQKAISARYGKAAYRSGFGVPHHVHVEDAELAATDEAALAPPLRSLTVVSRGKGAELLSRPELASVYALEVRNIEPAEFDALFSRPLPRLRELTLVFPRLNRARAARLFDGPLIQQLTTLSLSGHTMLADLFTRPRPSSLRKLALGVFTLDAAATEALFGGWAGLESLHLGRVTVDEATAVRVLSGDCLGRVERLQFSDCNGLGHRAIAALLGNPALTRLRALQCTAPRGETRMPAEALAAACLPAMEYLDLWDVRFAEGGGSALGGSGLATRLRGLRLGRAALGREDVTAMFAGDFHRLERLELDGARITGGSRAALLSAPWLTGLKHLGMAWCPLKPADGRALGRCAALSGLRVLDLDYCHGLGDEGLSPIVLSPHLARLEVLNADETNATAALARALPGAPMLAGLRLLSLDSEALDAAVGLGESARHKTFRSLYWDRGMPR
jgi:uncharacterized protein (TIGR02996 family)